MLGCRVCQISRFGQPENTLKMFIDQGVTFSAGVPTIWQGIRAALEASPVDRAGFKVSLFSASSLLRTKLTLLLVRVQAPAPGVRRQRASQRDDEVVCGDLLRRVLSRVGHD